MNNTAHVDNVQFLTAIFGDNTPVWVTWRDQSMIDEDVANETLPKEYQRKPRGWHGSLTTPVGCFAENAAHTMTFFSTASFPLETQTRSIPNASAFHVLVLDDVGEKGEPLPQIQPSYILETSSGSYHYGYILETPCTDMARANRLVTTAKNADDSGLNAVRYMRLPQGTNLKHGKGQFRNVLHTWSPATRYSIEALETIVGVDLNAPMKAVRTGTVETAFDASDDQMLYDVTYEHYEKMDPIAEGNRDEMCVVLANRIGDTGLSADQALTILSETNPFEGGLSHSQIEKCVRSAYRSRTKDIGCSAPQMVFKSVTSAQVPVKKIAATISPVVRPPWTDGVYPQGHAAEAFKKNDTENYDTFVGKWYPDDSIRTADQNLYRWNGIHWEYLDDTVLKSEIARAMMHSKPMKTHIENTLGILKFYTHSPNLVVGEWPGHDTSNIIMYQNGILNLNTMELMPHDKDFFSTNIMPYSYDPAAECPRWLKFINDIFGGDEECIALLQEWYGYMLVRDYSHQKAMLLKGVGRSGKGTIGAMMETLVGPQNYTGGSLLSLERDSALDAWQHKTVVFMGDEGTVPENKRGTIMRNFKALSGNDAIDFKRKWKGDAYTKLPTRITLAVNNIPAFFDDSGAMADRLLILPFKKSWLGKEDVGLGGKLREEITGIANWAIVGLKRLQANGRFTEPEASKAERDEISAEYSPLIAFIRDCCEYDPKAREFTTTVYDSYMQWCLYNKKKPLDRIKFPSKLIATSQGNIYDKKAAKIDNDIKQAFFGIRIDVEKMRQNVSIFPSAPKV